MRSIGWVNPFGHIDLRVSDIDAALEFYEALLPALGFTARYHGEAWKVWATTDALPSAAYFGITEEREHIANGNRIAFWVGSSTEAAPPADATELRLTLSIEGGPTGSTTVPLA